MRGIGVVAAAATGVGLGAAVRRLTSGAAPERQVADGWLVVTVNRPPEEIGSTADLPEPLTELDDRVEVVIRKAAGDKGIELAARPRDPGPDGPLARLTGEDPRQEVRLALRRAKSLMETGDVLRPDPSTTHPGPAGRLVRAATRVARGEGRL